MSDISVRPRAASAASSSAAPARMSRARTLVPMRGVGPLMMAVVPVDTTSAPILRSSLDV